MTVHARTALAASLAVLVFWRHPTPLRIIGLAIVTLVILGIIEFFGREPETEIRPASSSGGPITTAP